MKKGEEEMIRRNTKKSSSSSFPLDITSIILSKLPTKSLFRFRCVSKQWSSMTKDPYFTKSFETQSSTHPMLLACFTKGDKLFVFSISQHKDHNPISSFYATSSHPMYTYHTKLLDDDNGSFTIKTESVHGLIVIDFRNPGSYFVWNPTMKTVMTLPKLDYKWEISTIFLGYDPIGRKHKVACLPFIKTCDECLVLTLGSSDQELWRRVKRNHSDYHHPYINGYCNGKCINGVVYYHAKASVDNGDDHVIMSFDVRSEKFHVMRTFPWGAWNMMMTSCEGKLAFVGCIDRKKFSIVMWVLDDASKGEWSNHFYSPPLHYLKVLENQFVLCGVTSDGGELIYVQETLFKSSIYVIYIDPKRKTFRMVDYDGLVDDGFRRRNGLGDTILVRIRYIPNHIETLLSF